MKRLALALCLLSAPGWGDEVHFSTFPPGYVYQLAPESPNGRDLLGSTRKASVVQRRDGVFLFDYRELSSQDPSQPRDQITAVPRDFDQNGVFKRRIWLTLTPAEWAGYLLAQPLLYLAGLALASLAWGLRAYRRRLIAGAVGQRRQEELKQVGRFELGDMLGRGGCGAVYRARDDQGQPVAVKLMLPELSQDEASKKRFLREVQICSQLNHPNIIQLYDWGEQQGRLYLAMELLEGETLGDQLRRQGHLNPPELARLLPQIGSALSALHTRNLVHRDIKPDNMFLTEGGKLKLMDFGIALGQDLTRATQTGLALGTPSYMAPEQIKGQIHPASDQYSLGVLAYVSLTGRKPFEADDPVSLAYQHVHNLPPRPSQFRPDLPEAVDPTILRMLAKTPEERYPDIAAATTALSQALAGPTPAFLDEETRGFAL